MNITDVNLLDKQVDEFELLNKVSRLSLLEILLVRTNHKSGSGFGGATVLVGLHLIFQYPEIRIALNELCSSSSCRSMLIQIKRQQLA